MFWAQAAILWTIRELCPSLRNAGWREYLARVQGQVTDYERAVVTTRSEITHTQALIHHRRAHAAWHVRRVRHFEGQMVALRERAEFHAELAAGLEAEVNFDGEERDVLAGMAAELREEVERGVEMLRKLRDDIKWEWELEEVARIEVREMEGAVERLEAHMEFCRITAWRMRREVNLEERERFGMGWNDSGDGGWGRREWGGVMS